MPCVFYGNKKHFCEGWVLRLEMVTREGSLLQPVLGDEINGEVSYVEFHKAQNEVRRVCVFSKIPSKNLLLEGLLFEAALAKSVEWGAKLKLVLFYSKFSSS